ncbi:TonB-dependent receptor [uncultured Polaribacter sp.]|uniref:SusC/RagA family TonB-linked outer membrane protein n=1 Tax=uncultured Polaribacter sp. TaxID=174711 RepID=UPI00261A2D95|nr:TonB-dependent receptor [uncultured Polaribacter sp.]
MKKINLILLLLSISFSWNTFSQTVIKGTVKDGSGIPLPGVSVLEKGTQNGTTTNFEGLFQLTVKDNSVIVFSYLGFKQQEVKVTTNFNGNIVLKEDTESLDEIVVVGYGAQKKESVLGAIGQIKSEAIVGSGTTNISNALTGLTPGLNIVQTSGQPGVDAGQIFIRGNADPLILIDGVEAIGGFENIDLRNVENISVLKDGSTTAVYGIRGANGVIIITTKRGKIGKPVISASSEFSIKYLNDTYDSVDAFTAESLRNVGVFNDAAFDNGFTPQQDLDNWESGSFPYLYPNTDWIDYVIKDYALSNNHTVSIRGGTEFVKYFASVGYLKEGDITESRQFFNYDPENRFERFNFRSNLDFTLSKTTRLKTGITNRLENRNFSGSANFLGLYTAAPGTIPFYPAEALALYPDPLYPGLEEVRFPIVGVPGNDLSGSTNTNKAVFSLNLELVQDLDFITEGLKASARLNYTSSNTSSRSYNFDGSLAVRLDRYDLNRDGTWTSFEGPNYERPLEFIEGSENPSNTQEITDYKFQLDYNRSFGKHNVSALGVFRRIERVLNTAFPYYEEAWVARATYNYDATYFFEINGSYNGDEGFAEGNRFQLFPSVAAGFNLAKLDFIKNNIPAINNFKLRYSYGQSGSKEGLKIANTNPSQYQRWQYFSFYNFVTPEQSWRYNFGEGDTDRITAILETQLGNEDLTWSTVTKQNIGLEFGFLNNKISGELDFFRDNRDDLIARVTSSNVIAAFGSTAALPFANLGATESQGMELSLTYKDNIGDFKYSITGTYGFYENRVVSSALDGPGTPSYTTLSGKPIGTSNLLQTDGYFQNIDEVVNYPNYTGIGLGDLRYIDYNANGTVIGSGLEDQVRFDLPTAPKHSFSFILKSSYKNWSVSALVDGITGHEGIVNANLAYALVNGAAVARESQLDYWTPTNTDAQFPALHVGTADPNLLAATTDRIIDLDYIKLRSINISYNFNMDNFKDISSLRLYLTGNNLLTFSALDYIDPQGNRPQNYPIPSRFNLGLNVKF